MARTIETLKEHMEKHKDALVIIGPEAIRSLFLPAVSKEELEKSFNKKTLRRDIEGFWNFFEEKIYIKSEIVKELDVYKSIGLLANKGLIKTIVDLNASGLNPSDNANYIALHGSINRFICQKCKTSYAANSVERDEHIDHVCELCGSELRPDMLLFGESYNEKKFQAVVKALNETHTLITIGVDYAETPIVELIGDYGDLRDNSEEKMIVGIASPDLQIDLNEQITFHEFLVKDSCNKAAKRLLKGLI